MRKIIVILITSVLLMGCATSSSIKGTPTTVNTLSGHTFDAILLIDNFYEELKVAKDSNGNHILYADIITPSHSNPGALFFTNDKERIDIVAPSEWLLKDIDVSQYGVAYYWTIAKRLDNTFINFILNADNIIVRVVNAHGSSLMGKEEGSDISSILPQLKDFISK